MQKNSGETARGSGGKMVRPTGFEPVTYGLEERRAWFNLLLSRK